MTELVIAGVIAAMVDGDDGEPERGRVWIRDDAIVAVTKGATSVAGFGQAPVVDVGTRYVLPGLIDMHNHLAYNALPLWSEPGRTDAVAAQQALARRRHLHRVDHRAGVGVRQSVSGSAARLCPGAGDGGRSDRGPGLADVESRLPDGDAQRRRRTGGQRQLTI